MSDANRYLSQDTINNISLAFKRKEGNMDAQAYLLYDGTVITIEKQSKEQLTALANAEKRSYFIENPYDIVLSCPAKVAIQYSVAPFSPPEEIQIVANSFDDLERKWKRFKEVNNLSPALVATAVEVSFTKEQKEFMTKLDEATNDFLNTLLDQKFVLDLRRISVRQTDRMNLINMIVVNVARSLLMFDIADRAHVPFLNKDEQGRTIEVREYMTKDMIMPGNYEEGDYGDKYD